MKIKRRDFLRGAAAASGLGPSAQRDDVTK
ncbi:MAG TPA: twin-arginine translocation signal domain-containing protein [Vicinamibacteria bacterium]|jgi:hypothetical protein